MLPDALSVWDHALPKAASAEAGEGVAVVASRTPAGVPDVVSADQRLAPLATIACGSAAKGTKARHVACVMRQW